MKMNQTKKEKENWIRAIEREKIIKLLNQEIRAGYAIIAKFVIKKIRDLK